MVSLRDGKSYDPGASSDTATASGRSRRTSAAGAKDSTAVSRRGPVTRRSRPALERRDMNAYQEPPSPVVSTPSSTKTRAKRTRASTAQPLAVPELSELPDTYNRDTIDVYEASELELPEEPESTPSPVPRKRPRTSLPARKPSLLALLGLVLAAAAAVGVAAAAGAYFSGRDLGEVGLQAQELGLLYLQRSKAGAATYLAVLSQQSSDSLAAANALARQARLQLQQHGRLLLQQAQVQLEQLAAVVQQQMDSIAAAAKQQQQQAQQKKGAAGSAAAPAATYTTAAIAGLLPAAAQWQDLAQDISELLNQPPTSRSKGAAVLLVCGSPEHCATTSAALAGLQQGSSSGCSLQLSAPELASAADLQAALAPFLRGCPTGQVLLQQLEQLPLPAWSGLLNALSELGGFQHGGPVDATKAAYLLLLQLPSEAVAAAAASEEPLSASQQLKGQVLELLRGQAGEGADAEVEALARAIHRRLDFAVVARGFQLQQQQEPAAAEALVGAGADSSWEQEVIA